MVSSSLGGLDIRFNSETGKPEWKERGADTFNPFKSNAIPHLLQRSDFINSHIYKTKIMLMDDTQKPSYCSVNSDDGTVTFNKECDVYLYFQGCHSQGKSYAWYTMKHNNDYIFEEKDGTFTYEEVVHFNEGDTLYATGHNQNSTACYWYFKLAYNEDDN